jgi:hypothetical protein
MVSDGNAPWKFVLLFQGVEIAPRKIDPACRFQIAIPQQLHSLAVGHFLFLVANSQTAQDGRAGFGALLSGIAADGCSVLDTKMQIPDKFK